MEARVPQKILPQGSSILSAKAEEHNKQYKRKEDT